MVGSEEYADYRRQLLPAAECQKRLPEYCAAAGLAADGAGLVASLKQQLTDLAAEVDAGFPENAELTIGTDGKPHLKQLKKLPLPDGFAVFERAVQERMPEHHLLDILKNVQHWTGFTRHFGPPSGFRPQAGGSRPAVGPYRFRLRLQSGRQPDGQPSRGSDQPAYAAAAEFPALHGSETGCGQKRVIAAFLRFDVTAFWGDGKAMIADGTHMGPEGPFA